MYLVRAVRVLLGVGAWAVDCLGLGAGQGTVFLVVFFVAAGRGYIGTYRDIVSMLENSADEEMEIELDSRHYAPIN